MKKSVRKLQEAFIAAQKEIENKEPEESQDDLLDGVCYAAEFVADDVLELDDEEREEFLKPLGL